MTRLYSDRQWLSFAWSSVTVLKDAVKCSWSDTGLEKHGSDFAAEVVAFMISDIHILFYFSS